MHRQPAASIGNRDSNAHECRGRDAHGASRLIDARSSHKGIRKMSGFITKAALRPSIAHCLLPVASDTLTGDNRMLFERELGGPG
jgi:hypothetical protein